MRSGRRKASGSVVAEEGLKALFVMVRGKPGDLCSQAGREIGHKAVGLVRSTA